MSRSLSSVILISNGISMMLLICLRIISGYGRNGEMHCYASDSKDRERAIYPIAACSVLIAFLFARFLDKYSIAIPWWAESPSILLIYGLLYWAYDNRLWKLSIKGLRLSGIPDCGGTWYCRIASSHDGGTETEGCVVICQTWRRISVQFNSQISN